MKALVLDIECSPNVADVWSLWNVNVSLSQLRETSRTICFSAKWLDGRNVMFFSEHKHGREKMIGEAYALMDEADVLITYNGNTYDIPILHREFLLAGYTPPAPSKSVDLLKVVKKNLRFSSNKLDHVAQQLGLGKKTSHSGHDLWVRCMAGDDAAWKLMERYSRQDTRLTEALYYKLLPWIANHPSVRLLSGDDRPSCPNCGGESMHRRGTQVAVTGTYQRLHCQTCGAWSRSTKREHATTVIGIR